jgi:hypothetical protein
MENLSLKNIILTIIGGGIGYWTGAIFGTLLGFILWSVVALIFGELVFDSLLTVISHGFFSIVLGILLSLLVVAISRKLFGITIPHFSGAAVASMVGIFVLFTYGIKIIFHPGVYGQYNYMLGASAMVDLDSIIDTSLPPGTMAQLYYGTGTGQLIGSYFGTIAGLWIAFRETIGRKRKREDKEEFNKYTKFLNEKLKK